MNDGGPIGEDNKKHSIPFNNMADRIERNADAGFGGAYVIIPPGDSAPMAVLLLNEQQSEAMFLNVLQWQIKNRLDELEIAERRQQLTGMR